MTPNHPLEALMMAMPGAIEAQEAAGQRDLCRTAGRLPVRGAIDGDDKRAQWEAVGFVFGEPIKEPNGREVFVSCTFPPGWKLVPTDHSMWSDVVDAAGAVRAQVFFKAAFYDYSAHTFGLEVRYKYGADYVNNKDYSDRRMIHFVTDRLTKERVYSVTDTKQQPVTEFKYPNRKAVEEWLDETYPDHKNPLAYWPGA